MHQPEGSLILLILLMFVSFKKALYGLMQAPRAWHDRLKGLFIQQDFKASKSNTYLITQHIGKDILLILICMDDILITGSSSNLIAIVIQQLNSKYVMKSLEEFNYFLDIEVLFFYKRYSSLSN